MYRERILSNKLGKLAKAFPVVVVSGARQVGKTTLVRHLFPEYDYVQFDSVIDFQNARKDPDFFLQNHPAPLILDEIQYAPEVVSAVKRFVDSSGPRVGQYVVTGSQQWQVMASLSESLAGRAAFLDLEGFSLQEISGQGSDEGWLSKWLEEPEELIAIRAKKETKPEISLWEWLWRGFLPGAQLIPMELVPDFWTGYQRTYIERDARMAGDIQDWQQFGLFMRLASTLTAQEINHSQLGREIGMTPQTSRRWLQVMRATFQWLEIPAYQGNMIKRVSSKPKGYLADTGLACQMSQFSSPKSLAGHPYTGALFETAMVHEIRKQCARLSGGAFYHWRSSGGAEVDLLLERDGVFHPFEFKLKSNPSPSDASGITAFRAAYPQLKVGAGAILCGTILPFWVTKEVAALPWNTN